MIVDDYNLGACRLAVDTYRAEHGITAPLQRIDDNGVFWVKEATKSKHEAARRASPARTVRHR